MKSTDELDNKTSRECCNASVQTGIVSIDCGKTHVPGGFLCQSFAQETGLLSLLAKVEQNLQMWAIRVKLARVAHISTNQFQTNLANYCVQRQVDCFRCERVDNCSVCLGDLGEHMYALVFQVKVQVICTFNHTWLKICQRSIFAVEFICNNVLLHYRSK